MSEWLVSCLGLYIFLHHFLVKISVLTCSTLHLFEDLNARAKTRFRIHPMTTALKPQRKSFASTDSLKSNVMVGFSTLNDQETRTCKYCVYGTGLLEQFLGEIRLKRRHSLCEKESSLFLGTRRSKPRTALGNNSDNLTINNIKQKLSKLPKKKNRKKLCAAWQTAIYRGTTTTSFICMTITKYYSIAEAT